MSITCPRCLRSLLASDPHGPPVFCMYCGQRLLDDTRTAPPAVLPDPGGMRTASFAPTSAPEETVAEPAPRTIGGYRLLRLLGAGGMGTVYEAEGPAPGHRVAVKLLSSRLASNPSSVERFRQEGRLASQLTHPRCVFVVAADTDAGRPYIVMELMPGRTLKDLVDQKGPLPEAEAIAHILDVIDGLAEAHRLGVLHRDVKPSNCFLTGDGRVKVGDFGLSKSLVGSQDRHLTQSGAFLGTVLFASPEQLRGEPLDYGSDVYSVCATLYYLLCGEAPYQHESVTAALAKAISEPPPAVRRKRPDVSRPLERVVMRGLERDRDRRWQTLDDLRDALVGLLPARQVPARPRALVGAYVLDRILLAFLIVPAELLRGLLAGGPETLADPFELHPLAAVILLVYFTLGEGLFGATVGKWLLGLRVSRVGRTGPPGVPRAFVRAAAFTAIQYAISPLPGTLVRDLPRPLGGILGALVFGAGVFALLFQLRRTSGGYRGVHDFLSGCHVTQRPLPARKLRLVARHPNPLDTLLPPDPAAPLPETVGGYAIRGRVWADPSSEQVWAAEDRALGRRALLWLGAGPGREDAAGVSRPTRLRRLGRGRVWWGGEEYDWVAFAAPAGAPLADTVDPDRPLPWADVRFLLEQLVDELMAAEADGSMPARLSLGQVWVEPNGRVKLLDFPMPTASGVPSTQYPVHSSDSRSDRYDSEDSSTLGTPYSVLGTGNDPLVLLRLVASLALEGRPRSTPYPPGGWGEPGVRAPVPPHAAPILTKLFSPEGYSTLAALHRDLTETHAHPPEVTPSIRAAQIGLQAALLGAGLVLMFGTTGGLAVVLAKLAEVRAAQAERTLERLRDPAGRAELARLQGSEPALQNPGKAAARIEVLRDRKREEAEARRKVLLAPQRFALAEFDRNLGYGDEADPRAARELLVWSTAPAKSTAGRSASPWDPEAGPVWAVLVLVLLAWVATATAFRGGLSMALAGITLVRADGRRAYRRQCAVRALAVWLPVAALLAGSAWLQVYRFERVHAYAGLWLLAVLLLPVYVVIALRYPARPPQDRIAGTYLVPL